MTNGGNKNLMVLEIYDREQVVLDEVSDEFPQVSSREEILLAAGNIQHHAIESVGLVLLNQELLIESTGSDTPSELEIVDLVLTFLLIADSESQYLQLISEVEITKHEVKCLDDAIVSKSL